MKRFWLILIVLYPVIVFPAGEELLNLAGNHYRNREYYNAITEIMRYQHFYPDGTLIPESMILMGESYYKGGNPEKALDVFNDCYKRFPATKQGEEALYYSGVIKLKQGAYYSATKIFQEYDYVYKDGLFREEAIIDLCRTSGLAENYSEAERLMAEYRNLYPDGKYRDESESLAELIRMDRYRPKKNTFVAGLLSAVIPGSGYVYTGDYKLGALSFFTNGALIYLIYRGYADKNSFQMIFFSLAELSFYSYSISGSIRSAMEYNQGSDYKKEIQIGIKVPF